jgi:hypothetical protein
MLRALDRIPTSNEETPVRPSHLLRPVAALCLVAGAAGCGDNSPKSEADIKKELSETFQGGGEGLDAAVADCWAQILIDEVGVAKLRDVDLSADAPPAELKDEIAAAGARFAECDPSSAGG